MVVVPVAPMPGFIVEDACGLVNHIDALCHQAHCLTLFGGVPTSDAETPFGFTQLGVETVPPLVRRGVLLDVAGHKGLPALPAKYSITADDLAGCTLSQGGEVRKGDVLLVRTGYGAL